MCMCVPAAPAPAPRCLLLPLGGEGATAREVLRHKSVQKVVMVDIDQVCVGWHAGGGGVSGMTTQGGHPVVLQLAARLCC